MKLLTHNMLQCHIKGVKNGYPFRIEAEKVEVREVDYDPDFLRHIFPRLDWPALREAAAALGARPHLLFGTAAPAVAVLWWLRLLWLLLAQMLPGLCCDATVSPPHPEGWAPLPWHLSTHLATHPPTPPPPHPPPPHPQAPATSPSP